MSAESYLSRGVSPTKDEVKAAVKNQSKGAFPGAFCKLIDDIAGVPITAQRSTQTAQEQSLLSHT